MKITIYDNSGLKYDRSTYLTQPLGGTQTLATQLEKFLNAWTDIKTSITVVPELYSDIIIVLSDPTVATKIREQGFKGKLILWQHQSYDQPIVQSLKTENLWDLVVFVSHWQKDMFEKVLGVKNGIVIRNAIEPVEYRVKSRETLNLIYTSTPFRGLEVLLEVFKRLQPKYDYLRLNVYSGMATYQRGDDDFSALYDVCRSTPACTYYSPTGKNELYRALGHSHIFAYPCIWEETSCLSAIEALSAGCKVVTTGIGALPETTSPFSTLCDIKDYAYYLEKTIAEYSGEPLWQKNVIDREYSWNNRVNEWIKLLTSI